MLKRDEATNPNSCWSNGREDERMFVLLARDAAAPVAIRAWVAERIRLGKNQPCDPQIVEAIDCAARMEDEASRINYRPHGGGMAGHDVRDAGETELASAGGEHADGQRIPVLWFDRDGCGPDELALELQPFRAEMDGKIPASLGLRVRSAGLVIGADGLVDGGFNLGRGQVADMHRKLGEWLVSNR